MKDGILQVAFAMENRLPDGRGDSGKDKQDSEKNTGSGNTDSEAESA